MNQPNLFDGFLLNNILRRLCASGLRNWGIPSFALKENREQEKEMYLTKNCLHRLHCTIWCIEDLFQSLVECTHWTHQLLSFTLYEWFSKKTHQTKNPKPQVPKTSFMLKKSKPIILRNRYFQRYLHVTRKLSPKYLYQNQCQKRHQILNYLPLKWLLIFFLKQEPQEVAH